MKLAGKVALVTGGGRGIGRAISLGLAGAGADVAVIYATRQDAAEATAGEIRDLGRRAVAVRADVSEATEVAGAVAAVTDELGPIDILVNNAATHRREHFLEIPFDLWKRVIEVDLTGPFLMSQAVARQMAPRGYGKIIQITSVNAERVQPSLAHYSAAKAGLFGLTRGMAIDLAPYGIRVNAIAPGLVRTDLTTPVMGNPEMLNPRVARMPLGGPLEPTDFAAAAVFLASSDSDMVTGTTLTVDAGMSALA
jgi:NAD(P)-dependent dehydrogenase (short-subunit alcohol dehydrogenase family)